MKENIEEKYNWNLEDIFKTENDFQLAKQSIEKNLEDFERYKGILCDNADTLYSCYSLYEEILKIFEKVYSYGMFKYHLNMADQEGIKKFKEVENLSAKFETAISFITPEITYAEEDKILGFFQEKAELKRYERDIKEI